MFPLCVSLLATIITCGSFASPPALIVGLIMWCMMPSLTNFSEGLDIWAKALSLIVISHEAEIAFSGKSAFPVIRWILDNLVYYPLDLLSRVIYVLLRAIWRLACYVVRLLTGSLRNYIITTTVAAPLFYLYAPSLGVGVGIIWTCYGLMAAYMDQ